MIMQITHEADPYLSIQIQKGWDTFDKYYYLSDQLPVTELDSIPSLRQEGCRIRGSTMSTRLLFSFFLLSFPFFLSLES